MDGAKEDLVDMFIVHTVEEIQVICTAIQIFSLRINAQSHIQITKSHYRYN